MVILIVVQYSILRFIKDDLLLKMKDAAYLKQQQQEQKETLIYATESISGRIRI